MSKRKHRQSGSAGGGAAAAVKNNRSKESNAKVSTVKKKKRFKYAPQKRKETKPDTSVPPGDPEKYSTNWKTLLGMLSSQQTAKTYQPTKEGPKAKTPQSATDKDLKPTHEADKDLNKAGHRPHKDFNKNLHSVKTKSTEQSGAQQNGKRPSGPGQHRAKKTKLEDGEGERKSWAKKKKVEEVEMQTAEPDIWFDDVDPDDIEAAVGPEAADIVRKRTGMKKMDAEKRTESALVKENAFEGLTRTVAMDCEMVGVGPDGEESMLARVSLVNQFGKCVYDKYVKPTEPVTDYRTAVSGIRPADIEHGEDIKTVQREVAEILNGRILVGHAIHNDLKILLLDHPKKMIRDTQKYKPFKEIAKSGRPALRVLCREVLNVRVQQGEHSSVQDAQATMRLYTLVKRQWEMEIKASKAKTKSETDANTPHTSISLGQ